MLVGVSLSGCPSEQGGGVQLIDHGVCDVLIDCAASLAPETRDEYESVYGPAGTCWAGGPQQWAACRDACRQTLDALNLVAQATGEACGTCQTDADCSSYGVGAYCDAGYCVAGGQAGDESGGQEAGDGDGDGDVDPFADLSAVSILLILDNSGSMGPAERVLVETIGDLIAPLDSAGVAWRVGVTTTDTGNPWCPPGTYTPEDGELVLSSCRERLNDFLFNNGQLDHRDLACNDVCGVDTLTTVPSTTATDPNSRSRPWIESLDGQTNLAGVSVNAALRCAVPQGIGGCGFETPLQAARRAIARSADPDDPQYGFVEPGRLLVILFISDEVDCSYNPQYESIFEGNKTFWSDPAAQFPTSALCWNAGVQCSGSSSGYDSCKPVNYDEDGDVTNDPARAVLRPVDGLIDSFGQPTLAFGILGVGSDGQPHYSATDPELVPIFGIDPGCVGAGSSDVLQGLPPVRMWSVLQQLGPEGQQAAYSICEPGFGGGMAEIGGVIASYF